MDTPPTSMDTPPTNELELAERFKALTATADSLARSTGILRRITRKLAAPEGYEALKKLQKDLKALATLEIATGSVVEDARAAGDTVSEWLADEWQRRASGFVRELVAYLRERDVGVSVEGTVITALPLTIEVHAEHDRAVLLYADEALKDRLPLRADRIYDEWLKAQARLARKTTPPELFADALIAAYEDVRRLNGSAESPRLRLSDVHFQLFARRQSAQARHDPRKSRVKEYPRYQFAWDLAALVQAPEWLDRGDGMRIELRAASESAARSRSASVRCVVGDGEQAFADVRVV